MTLLIHYNSKVYFSRFVFCRENILKGRRVVLQKQKQKKECLKYHVECFCLLTSVTPDQKIRFKEVRKSHFGRNLSIFCKDKSSVL